MHRPPCFVLCDSTERPRTGDQKKPVLGGQGQQGRSVCVCVCARACARTALFSKMASPSAQEEEADSR